MSQCPWLFPPRDFFRREDVTAATFAIAATAATADEEVPSPEVPSPKATQESVPGKVEQSGFSSGGVWRLGFS